MDRKRYNITIIILGAMAGLGPFTIDMYIPGFPQIVRDLNTDMALVGLTLTSYFIGLCSGQFIIGPLLERFGRKKPLIIGLIIYIIAAVGCIVAPSVYFLIALRFFLSIGVCVGGVASNAIIRDLFSGREMARAISLVQMVFGVAPTIAPAMGGMVVSEFGWRYVFLVLAFIGVFVFLSVKFYIPETKGADVNYSLKPGDVFRGYVNVLKEKQFVFLALASGTTAGGLFAYITNSPFVYIDVFGFTTAQFGGIFGLNALSLVIGAQFNRIMLRKYNIVKILLMIVILQTIVIIPAFAGIFSGFISIPVLVILMSVYWFCVGGIFPNSGALALQPFTSNIGSASAFIGGMQMFFGAVSSALAGYINDGTAIPMLAIMCIFTIISLLLFAAGSRLAAIEL